MRGWLQRAFDLHVWKWSAAIHQGLFSLGGGYPVRQQQGLSGSVLALSGATAFFGGLWLLVVGCGGREKKETTPVWFPLRLLLLNFQFMSPAVL